MVQYLAHGLAACKGHGVALKAEAKKYRARYMGAQPSAVEEHARAAKAAEIATKKLTK